jgi:hypothetical protein
LLIATLLFNDIIYSVPLITLQSSSSVAVTILVTSCYFIAKLAGQANDLLYNHKLTVIKTTHNKTDPILRPVLHSMLWSQNLWYAFQYYYHTCYFSSPLYTSHMSAPSNLGNLNSHCMFFLLHYRQSFTTTYSNKESIQYSHYLICDFCYTV